MRKTTVSLVITLWLTLLCGLARADFTAQVDNTEGLNMRIGPGTEYAWIGSLKRGDLVRVTGESGNWYLVQTMDGSLTGYMSKNFLLPVENNLSQLGRFAVVVNTQTLNLRSGPGSDYTWLGSLGQGGWVEVLGESGNWYQVALVDAQNGLTQRGYMSKNFLTLYEPQGTQANSLAVVQNPAGTRFLNLRKSPSYDAEVLGIYYNGAVCTILERRSDGWCYVSLQENGQTRYGYFRGEYLVSQLSATVNTRQNGGNGGKLNLRSQPSYAGSLLRQIPNNASVSVLLKGTGFWEIEYDGTIGFVDVKFMVNGGATGGSGTGGGTATGSAVVQTGNSGKLNLREQANASARVLAQYANGTAVQIIEKGTAWCYVRVNGLNGYMMTRYLRLNGSATATKRVVNPNGGAYVNLRSAPQKNNGNVFVRVPVGVSVTLLAWGAEWSQVSYNGTTGYMMSWFLK